MKLSKIILTGVFATALVSTSLSAIGIEDSTKLKQVSMDEDKKPKQEIELSALPEAITEELKKEKYTEWEAKKAFIITSNEGNKYEVLVTKEDQEMSLFFNEDGNVIEK